MFHICFVYVYNSSETIHLDLVMLFGVFGLYMTLKQLPGVQSNEDNKNY